MSHYTTLRGRRAGFEIEPRNRFGDAIRAIAEFEIRPGNTVSFLSQVDLTAVERVRAWTTWTRRPSYTAFVVKAVALALRDCPYANRRVCRRMWPPLSGPRLQKFLACDVAVACERDIPGAESTAFLDILRDADHRSLTEITEALHALAVCDVTTNKQWREFSTVVTRPPSWLSKILLRLPCFVPSFWADYRGGAALVSSPAKYGVDAIAGTWTHPVGVSFGLVKRRPVVRGESIVACPTFTLTLNFDRRIMAGAQAARFFNRIVERLERVDLEIEESPAPVTPLANATATSALELGYHAVPVQANAALESSASGESAHCQYVGV